MHCSDLGAFLLSIHYMTQWLTFEEHYTQSAHPIQLQHWTLRRHSFYDENDSLIIISSDRDQSEVQHICCRWQLINKIKKCHLMTNEWRSSVDKLQIFTILSAERKPFQHHIFVYAFLSLSLSLYIIAIRIQNNIFLMLRRSKKKLILNIVSFK